MKRFALFALVLVLAVGVLAGCRSKANEPTNSAPETSNTQHNTTPDVEEMIPGPEDTIDPSSGANVPGDDAYGDSMPSMPDGETEHSAPTDEAENGENSRMRPRSRILPSK